MKFNVSDRLQTAVVAILIFLVLGVVSGANRERMSIIDALVIGFVACVGAYVSHRTRTNSATSTEAKVWRWMRTVLTGLGVFVLLILASAPLGGIGSVELLIVLVVAGTVAFLDHRRRMKRAVE